MASLLHPIVYLCIHAYLKGVDCGVCRKSSCTHWTVRSITGAASSCDVTLPPPPPCTPFTHLEPVLAKMLQQLPWVPCLAG